MEFLLTRRDFPWPDLRGETITLQDCFRARGKTSLQDAARECLRRMNARIVEMPDSRDAETYDGTSCSMGPPHGTCGKRPGISARICQTT